MQTLLVFTSEGRWGKSSTLEGAMKNASLKRSQEFIVKFIATDPKDVEVDSMGCIHHPPEAITYLLTDTAIKK